MGIGDRPETFPELERASARRARIQIAKIFLGLVITGTSLAGLYVVLGGLIDGLVAGLLTVGAALVIMVVVLAGRPTVPGGR